MTIQDIKESVNIVAGIIGAKGDFLTLCEKLKIPKVDKSSVIDMIVQTGKSRTEAHRLIRDDSVRVEDGFLFIGKRGYWLIS